MSRLVIGIHGEQGSGKDTVADYLVANAGFTKIAFADALKAEIQAAWRLTPINVFLAREFKTIHTAQYSLKECYDQEFLEWYLEKYGNGSSRDELARPRSLRWVMQTWGTEYRRSFDDRYWIKKVEDKLAALAGRDDVVVSDVRYENEAKALRAFPYMGDIWHVVRPVNPYTSVGKEHSSEKRLPHPLINRVVHNVSDLAFLQANAQLMLGKTRAEVHTGKRLLNNC